jgi:hypothetical protein
MVEMKSNSIPDRPRGVLRPEHPLRPWLIGLIYWVALVPPTLAPKLSGNVSSRYMTIESLVERGTLAVGRSPMLRRSGSPDLARFRGRLYSDKPPVLSALGAAVYAPLYGLGVRFLGSAGQFALVNLVLVTSLVGAGSALALVGIRQLLQMTSLPSPWADLLTLGGGFGTLLLTYGVTFNNHSVAAGLITLAFARVLREGSQGHRTGWRRMGAGLLVGLAATIDLPAGGAMLVALAAWLTARSRSLPLTFLVGAGGPLLLHAVLQAQVTGTPLPVEMYPEAIAYPGSYWATEAGRWTETMPRWRFGLELLVGPQGWLTVTPALGFGVLGLILVGADRTDPLRPAAGVVAGVVIVLWLYYTWGVRRTDFSGQSFGTRHLLPITPLGYAFAVIALDRLRSRLAAVVFAVLFGVGTVYAVAGMQDPWSRIERRPDVALRVLQRFVLYPRSSYAR